MGFRRMLARQDVSKRRRCEISAISTTQLLEMLQAAQRTGGQQIDLLPI